MLESGVEGAVNDTAIARTYIPTCHISGLHVHKTLPDLRKGAALAIPEIPEGKNREKHLQLRAGWVCGGALGTRISIGCPMHCSHMLLMKRSSGFRRTTNVLARLAAGMGMPRICWAAHPAIDPREAAQ